MFIYDYVQIWGNIYIYIYPKIAFLGKIRRMRFGVLLKEAFLGQKRKILKIFILSVI